MLITAFEPYNNRKINVSAEILKTIQQETNYNTLLTPVIYNTAAQLILSKYKVIKPKKPKYVIMLGESKKVKDITLELKAHNLDNSPIKDNAGALHIKAPINNRGPKQITTKIDNHKIQKLLEKEGYKVVLSNNAGSFVCNNTLYNVGKGLKNTKTNFGFIHIPANTKKIKQNTEIILKILEWINNELI